MGGATAVQRRGRIYVLLAAVAWSSAGVLQRELSVDTATQVAGRAAFALLGLLAFVAVSERGDVLASFRAAGRAGAGFAICIAISSATFIVALNHTTVANVLFLQAASPIVSAVLARLALGEEIARRTWVAMIVALLGVGLMVGGPGGFSFGVGIAVVMMLGFAGGLVFARHRSDVSMAPATCVAQLLIVVAFAPFAHWGRLGGHDVGVLAGLGIGQIGLGLALLTLGAQLLPAAEVALISLLEVVLGPLWVWISRSERPAALTIAGGVVVVVAVALQTRGASRNGATIAAPCATTSVQPSSSPRALRWAASWRPSGSSRSASR